MTAVLDAPLSDTTPGIAIFNVDTEDGVTSFAWTMTPWEAYTEVWLSGEDAEDLETLARLPWLYDDGQDTDVASLEMFTSVYREAGVLDRAFPNLDTFGEDPILLASQIIDHAIRVGQLAWDADEQTLRALV